MPTIKVPGKLMLVGEWAILEPGNHCIVMAIDKYISANIAQSNTFTFNLPNLNLPIIKAVYEHGKLKPITPLTQEQEKLFLMVKTATEIGLEYINRRPLPAFALAWLRPTGPDDKCRESLLNLANRYCHPERDSGSILRKLIDHPFNLSITSEISNIIMPDGSQHKLGFGSSAAAVVATIKAIFAFYEHEITSAKALEKIFKLAVIAHYKAQGNCGSGFDIAAATYGTTIIYQRFDQLWLAEQLKKNMINNIITQPWPDLTITRFKLPENIIMLVGFSGKSANTSKLIKAMDTYKKRAATIYTPIITSINELVKAIGKNQTSLFDAINHNRLLLAELAQKSSINLETAELTKLITIAQNHGAAAKFSGAGGGDCGIALCTDQAMAEKIKRDWLAADIIPIDVKIL